jgi:hypothetical protein
MPSSAAPAPEPIMKRARPIIAVPLLAAALAASGAASAQAYGSPYGVPVVDRTTATDGYYDYARVIRVVPVIGAPEGYPASASAPRCTTRQEPYAGGYAQGGAPNGGYYGPDGRYYGDYYGSAPRSRGSEGGRTVAGVIGTVIGAVVGSQVGGGSARYATAAIGSAVGNAAGRQVYDNAHRDDGPGAVTVCDPVNAAQPYPGGAYPGAGRNGYDVTYEYGGRTYVSRMAYDPGERVRVRVDVRPE